jgi:PAS domain S-box-containing protein
MSYKSEIKALREALEGQKLRVTELQSLLVQITQEAEERGRALEQMTEQWISMKTFNESVLQSLTSGLISVDRKGRITYMNRGAERILQYGSEEVKGKPLGVALACKDKQDLLRIRGLTEDEPSLGRQARVMRKDGAEIPIGFTVSPHLDGDGHEIGKIVHFRDLSEVNEMQEELLRMDRVVSLGEISMGIAHEIRNPLAGIRITAQALEEELGHNEIHREYVARIISEIDRLNELLKSFFSFAKPQRPQLEPCHLPGLVRDVLLLLRKDLADRRILVEEEYAAGLPPVPVDMNQMKQVVLNLLLNAVQAIGKEGVVGLGMDVGVHGGRREAVLRVSDTGKGILPEHQAKIFDPFFTTKAKGLGLGLSITYRIVKRHGGRIRVQSESGKGTTFFVHIPVDLGVRGGDGHEAPHPDRR